MKKLSLAFGVLILFGLVLLNGCKSDNEDPDPTPAGELYPRTTFDLDEYEATLNDFGKNYGVSDLGTLTRPAVPVLPQGTLTEVVASSATALTDAAAQGTRDITITGDINGTVYLGRATDVIIRLNGFRIDHLSLHQFGFTTVAATRVLVIGPGIVGSVNAPQEFNDYPRPTDILFDGVWIGPDFQSTPGDGGFYFRGQRIGVVNCIFRGYSAPVSGVAGPLMGGEDICFYNTNIGAGLNATGNFDDWGYRMADWSSRHVLADCMIRSRVKPCVRQGGAEIRGRVLYSTPKSRGTDRMMTLYNRYSGNMDASIPQTSNGVNTIDTDRIVNLFVRWFAANESGGNVTLWGPGAFTDRLYLTNSIELTCATALASRLGIAARGQMEQYAESGEHWDLDGGDNTESVVGQLPEVSWPSVISPAVGNIGSDPYDDPM